MGDCECMDEEDEELRGKFMHQHKVIRKDSIPRMRRPKNEHRTSENSVSLQRKERCFNLADKDQDGFLSATELHYWFEKHNCPLVRWELEKVMKLADKDKDNKLSFQEFCELCDLLELKDFDKGTVIGSEETFYDCLETPYMDTFHGTRLGWHRMKRASLEQLQGLVKASVKHFEDQTTNDQAEDKLEQLRKAQYELRLDEIYSSSNKEEVDFLKIRKDLNHPQEELVKGPCYSSSSAPPPPPKDPPKEKVYRTELFITPEHNQPSPTTTTADHKTQTPVVEADNGSPGAISNEPEHPFGI